MTTAIHRLVEALRQGEHPQLICRMRSGWVVLAEKQVLRGYCLLVPDPVVADLNTLPPSVRTTFLEDMALLGDALLAVTDAARINYEMLGNLEPALHAHIVPRYDHEPDDYRTRPFWFYDWDAADAFDAEKDLEFVQRLRAEIESLLTESSAAADHPR